MNIWIINHHAITPEMGGGTRHYDFAKELLKRGHSVTIFASSFHYAKYQEMREYGKADYIEEDIEGIEWFWFKTPPYFSNGISRVKSMLSFSFNLLKYEKEFHLQKPDVIIGSSVHLFAVYAAYRLAKKYGVPFIFEVRDLWPQTLIDMGMSRYHPFVLLQSVMEKFLYKKADHIITLLPKAHEYIEKLTTTPISWISNGTRVRHLEGSENLLRKNCFNVLYTGSMGQANDLELLIEAATLLKEHKNIHFTLIGDGVEKKRLQSLALNNVTFLDAVSKERVFDYLQSADLLYVGLQDLPLYRFGMSMNKVFDYMSAKKPILFVSSIEPNIVEDANAGFVLKDASVENVAELLQSISKTDKNTLSQYGENGYNYLLKNFTIEVLVDKLEKTFLK